MTIDATACQRIVLAGGPGSGKTTLARRLSSTLGLIHYELDRVVYGGDGGIVATPRALAAFASELAAEEAWLVEGDYVEWVAPLLERADAICLIDTPAPRALWQCFRRELNGAGGGQPRAPLWNFMRRCAMYYARAGSTMHPGRPAERSIDLARSPRFAHKVRRFRSPGEVRLSPPPAAALARRQARLSMVESAVAFLREHGPERAPWLWYGAREPYRGVCMAIAAASGWKDRLVATDFPDRTDVVTGRRRPLPLGEPVAIITSRADSLETARQRSAAHGVRLAPLARRSVGRDDESFDVIVVTPEPASHALVRPAALAGMRAWHGAVHRERGGVRVVTPRQPWAYGACLDVASAVPDSLADAVGYLRVRGVLDAGPVGLGLLGRDGQAFVARRALAGSRRAVDVYVPVARLGDAATLVIQTWSDPSPGMLTVAAVDVVVERDARA